MHIEREHFQVNKFDHYLAFLSNNHNISLFQIFKLKVFYEVLIADRYFPINTYEVIDHFV